MAIVPPPENIYADGREYDRLGITRLGDDEISFFADYGKNPSCPILELGCGTGRLAIPMALRGFDVTGIDVANSMLVVARRKAAEAGVKLELVHGDIRDFSLDRRFGLIFIPNNTIAHLLTYEDLRACLSSVKRHLDAAGRFIIAAFNPSLPLLSRELGRRYPVTEYVDESGQRVEVSETLRYDSATQINHLLWYFVRGDCETVRSLDLRMYFPQELEALLDHNGFTVVEKFDDYQRAPFTGDSNIQVLVCTVREAQLPACKDVA